VIAVPWRAELIASPIERRSLSHVVFDFDGTLSWLRSGWPDLMAHLFREYLPARFKESPSVLAELRRDILALNGKPSIYQMRRFHERAREFNFVPPAPEELLDRYLSRLDVTLQFRIESLIRCEIAPDHFVIVGARSLLNALHERGLQMIILSGTAEPDVRCEAELLGLAGYFGEHIYGSTPGKDFSKKDVIDRIIREEGIEGAHLLSFGDGPIEIEFTKAAGGLAIGVASDENANGSGLVDEDKRQHLCRAGADAIIPDYRNTQWILETFFP
jgi:phosphoglycolate phosphatase